MITLKCQCCEYQQEFTDYEAAFQEGWDAPPHFTGYIACNLCPAVCIALELSHKKAHEYWKIHGRPAEFNEYCTPDEEFGDKEMLERSVESGKEAAKKEIEEIKEEIREIKKEIEKVKKQVN